MLKNISLILGLSSSLLISAPLYIELKTGVCLPQKADEISYKKAPTINVELGYKLTNKWRFGLQVGFVQYINKQVKDGTKHRGDIFNHNKTDFSNCRFTAITNVANIYYDYEIKENLGIYCGLGAGVARLKYHFYDNGDIFGGGNIGYNCSKNVWCVQIMAGITYDINDHWALSLGYRCMKMENVKFKNEEIEVVAADALKPLKTPYLHSLELGLRYSF